MSIYRDGMSAINILPAIPPVVQTNSDAAIVGNIIDTLGYDSLTFAIAAGALTDADATFAVSMEHGDNSALSDTAAVASTNLVGTLALAAFTAASDDNKTRKVGYVGPKRYVRLTITPTGNNAGAAAVAAVAILGNLSSGPAPNPPA